jgi:hypothetical protein
MNIILHVFHKGISIGTFAPRYLSPDDLWTHISKKIDVPKESIKLVITLYDNCAPFIQTVVMGPDDMIKILINIMPKDRYYNTKTNVFYAKLEVADIPKLEYVSQSESEPKYAQVEPAKIV